MPISFKAGIQMPSAPFTCCSCSFDIGGGGHKSVIQNSTAEFRNGNCGRDADRSRDGISSYVCPSNSRPAFSYLLLIIFIFNTLPLLERFFMTGLVSSLGVILKPIGK